MEVYYGKLIKINGPAQEITIVQDETNEEITFTVRNDNLFEKKY